MFRDVGPGGGATLEEMVLAADRRHRLLARGATMEVVDPYAEPRKGNEAQLEGDWIRAFCQLDASFLPSRSVQRARPEKGARTRGGTGRRRDGLTESGGARKKRMEEG